MCLDYLVLPTVAVIQAALAMVRLVPHVPYPCGLPYCWWDDYHEPRRYTQDGARQQFNAGLFANCGRLLRDIGHSVPRPNRRLVGAIFTTAIL